MTRKRPNLVYSTDNAEMERIRALARAAQKPVPVASLPPEKQTARIRHEKKGRGGKTVTVVENLQLSDDDLKALARALKQACGTGGAVEERTVIIQGDQRERISAEMERLGYRTKVVGNR
jgi:translation initiation factor 1